MMKGQKGITLVALIITIIVMLILVGVTISVALNGGLFTKARTAVDETKKTQLDEAVNLVLSYYIAEKEYPTEADTYSEPSADQFQTELQKYISDVTVTSQTSNDEKTWFKVVSDNKTLYVNITDFATSPNAPSSGD